MRRAAKTDANQKIIVEGLRALGCTVQPLHAVGKGCPDLLVGFHGQNFLLEVKTPSGKMTKDENEWLFQWYGQIAIVRTLDEALNVVGIRIQ